MWSSERRASSSRRVSNRQSLWIMMNGDRNVVVRDAKGVAAISTYDVLQSNGVIHVVDKVLLPS
jgi:uncharacterized surface protein with fasciclin (FAS1) repeats